jgi:hypothetical protein
MEADVIASCALAFRFARGRMQRCIRIAAPGGCF